MLCHTPHRIDYCSKLYAKCNKRYVKGLEKLLNSAIRSIYKLDILTEITSFAGGCHFLLDHFVMS